MPGSKRNTPRSPRARRPSTPSWPGLRSDTASPGRSWASAGQTPTVKVNGRRFRVNTNTMSAIASRGSLWFTVFTGKFTAKVFTAFLDRLARQAGRKANVIADRPPVHRGKAVRAWLADNTERSELHLMPGYSPELNPDEILNADLIGSPLNRR
ncbi:transposase [Streptomyces sp. NPDC051561]|uniref:transposase n=1 Tax=Streptomyces sp. NPDC051561 TaxID=3365658 RepID=UPI0037A628A9